jgi:hypothetical protein
MRDKFEKFESLTNGIKNLAFLLAAVAVIVFLWPSLKQVVEGDRNIRSIDAFGVKLTLSEIINREAPEQGKEDQAVPEQVAKVAEKIEVGGPLWSFVGTYKDSGYVKSNFDIQNVPKVGDILTAKTQIYRRAREPRFTLTGWKMGKVEGVIKLDQKVKVMRVERIPAMGGGYQDWVQGIIME